MLRCRALALVHPMIAISFPRRTTSFPKFGGITDRPRELPGNAPHQRAHTQHQVDDDGTEFRLNPHELCRGFFPHSIRQLMDVRRGFQSCSRS